MSDTKPFNPIAIPNIALNLALEVLEQPLHPLPPVDKPVGAGVYLLYYRGYFEPYLPFQEPKNEKIPIYVGKADRKGMRKGFKFDPPQAHEMSSRLGHHIKSIEKSENLEVRDFYCRYLSVEDSFIGLAESILVSIFDPLWNRILDGFGNNPTGSPRSTQAMSKWDQFHPGRQRGFGDSKIEMAVLTQRVTDYFLICDGLPDERLIQIRQRIEKYGLA
jgi:hypothetical protein